MNTKKEPIEPKPFEKESSIYWQLIAGSLSDLSKLDFSILNLQFMCIDSAAYLDILAKYDGLHGGRTKDAIDEIKEKFWDSENLYLLMPIDYTLVTKEEDYWFCIDILKLIFPSDLTVYSDISFQFLDDKHLYWGSIGTYRFNPSGEDDIHSYYLKFTPAYVDEINEFIKLFISRFDDIKFIKPAFYSYNSSFSQRESSMALVSLCIGLEAVTNGTTELSYRIKRNVSILIGENMAASKLIFKNINNIYKVRSSIVHSGNYKNEAQKTFEYLPYLTSVVSRLIIEVILQNIKDLKEINDILTSLGFGDRNKISSDYKAMIINPEVHDEVQFEELN